uniref:Uncharacterized protein n=1 Tax=Gorilla gorilla gorilla TaxID=9595 RepID=A0A2I2ZU27_GORGO
VILYTIFLKIQEDSADYGDLWASLRIAFPLRFFLSVSHTFSPNFRHTLPAFPLLIHSSPSLNLIVCPVACCRWMESVLSCPCWPSWCLPSAQSLHSPCCSYFSAYILQNAQRQVVFFFVIVNLL